MSIKMVLLGFVVGCALQWMLQWPIEGSSFPVIGTFAGIIGLIMVCIHDVLKSLHGILSSRKDEK